MLNLFKLNTRKANEKKVVNMAQDKEYYKDYPVSTREWNNSIYAFNKNTLALIPLATISAICLIKGYLILYNSNVERNLRRKRLLQSFRRLSGHKTYVGNGEFKHTNSKVIITLYTYNRQRFNYLSVLKKRYLALFYKNKKIRKILKKRFYLIKYKGLKYLEQANKDKFTLIKRWNKFKIKNRIFRVKSKSFYLNEYLTKFYKKWVKKSLKRIKFYLYHKQLLYINESKYNYTYLQDLKNLTQKIYNKKVEFNLINIKYHYLNSDILSESLTLKITINRRKMLKFLRILIKKIKTHKTHKEVSYEPNLNRINLIDNIDDPIESFFNTKSRPNIKTLKTVVLDEIKYKRLSGVRLEAKGRLTKRYTASKSVRKIRYKGNLLNVDSSYKGLSTVILKGNLRSNIQYTKLNSKTRIGSFGIKGSISGS